MLKYLLFFTASLLLILSCQTAEPLPNTPETVSRQWQEHINNNQFAQAKKLSTTNAKEWVNWIEKMIVEEEPGEALPPPIFLEMTCKEIGDKATCLFLQEDAGEQFRDSFFLFKINGQWLVDIPEEDLEMDDTMEQLFNQMEDIINEEESE